MAKAKCPKCSSSIVIWGTVLSGQYHPGIASCYGCGLINEQRSYYDALSECQRDMQAPHKPVTRFMG